MNLAAMNTSKSIGAAFSSGALWLILLLALVVRIITYNGIFGSDDLVYLERASQLARNEWLSANYNGALRYGFNLPTAVFIAIFGTSPFVANLWPLLCSLVEIGAVFIFTNAVMNFRAGVFASLLLATTPLHMAVATRIHADPVVSMFITVSFVLLYFGAQQRQRTFLFLAGCTIGGIFWTKELAAVTWFAFLPMLWLFRGQWRNCLYVIAGTVFMMLLHGLLMYVIASDPLHLVKVVTGAVNRNFINGGPVNDGAAYYLRYLFIDVRHIGALAYLALAAVVLVPRMVSISPQMHTGFIFTLIWLARLPLVLSVFPVSLNPLRFPMKQSNYITLFIAPVAVLAGMTVATLSRRFGHLLLFVCVTFGLLLGALQQADYRVFSANSKALALFAAENPHALIVGSVNNSRLGSALTRIDHPGLASADIVEFDDFNRTSNLIREKVRNSVNIFVVLDAQTLTWGATKAPSPTVLSCWQHIRTLTPVGLAWSNELANRVSQLLHSINRSGTVFDNLARPRKAEIYRVNGTDILCQQ